MCIRDSSADRSRFILLPYSLRKWKYGDGKKSCSRLLEIMIVLHSKHEKSHFSKSVCAVSYTHLDVYKRQVLTSVFSMANDNSRKFKQNQILLHTALNCRVLKTYCFW